MITASTKCYSSLLLLFEMGHTKPTLTTLSSSVNYSWFKTGITRIIRVWWSLGQILEQHRSVLAAQESPKASFVDPLPIA